MNRPFDGAHYKALLKGLDISVLKLSEVVASSPTFRIDNQFFRKEFLVCDLGAPITSVGDACVVRSGTTPPDRDDDLRSGVVLLKTDNIRNSVLPSSVIEGEFYYITDELSAEMKDTVLQPQDVLINIVGASTDVIGRVAYVPEDFPKANITQAMALMRVGDKRINSAYLFSFLAGRYGHKQVRRIARPTGQYNMNLPEVRSLNVPILGRDVQSKIQELVNESYVSVSSGREATKGAEEILLSTLGLDNWKPPEPLTYTRYASDVFIAGRFDAEYFQPIYEALFAKFRAMGSVRLGSVVTERIRRGISPQYVEGGDMLVVNSQHVGATEVELSENRYTSSSLIENDTDGQAKGVIRKGDVLLNSTGRVTIGRCQCLLMDVQAVADNHVAIIRPDDQLDPVYLACFLNSRAGLMQTEQGYSGSSGQIELRPDVVADYVVWKAPKPIQLEIRKKIEMAHVARNRGHALLEQAKRAVEIAIEESESAALKYLSEHGEK